MLIGGWTSPSCGSPLELNTVKHPSPPLPHPSKFKCYVRNLLKSDLRIFSFHFLKEAESIWCSRARVKINCRAPDTSRHKRHTALQRETFMLEIQICNTFCWIWRRWRRKTVSGGGPLRKHIDLFFFDNLHFSLVRQVAQASRRLATGWTAWLLEGWRFFFTPSCSDWSWRLLSLLKMSTGGFPRR